MPESDYTALSLEVKALDAVHDLLDKNPKGLTVGTIAHSVGVGVGYLQGILKNTQHVLKRRGLRWVSDWTDLMDWVEWRQRRDFVHYVRFERHGIDLVRISSEGTIRVANAFRDQRGNRKVSKNDKS